MSRNLCSGEMTFSMTRVRRLNIYLVILIMNLVDILIKIKDDYLMMIRFT